MGKDRCIVQSWDAAIADASRKSHRRRKDNDVKEEAEGVRRRRIVVRLFATQYGYNKGPLSMPQSSSACCGHGEHPGSKQITITITMRITIIVIVIVIIDNMVK